MFSQYAGGSFGDLAPLEHDDFTWQKGDTAGQFRIDEAWGYRIQAPAPEQAAAIWALTQPTDGR